MFISGPSKARAGLLFTSPRSSTSKEAENSNSATAVLHLLRSFHEPSGKKAAFRSEAKLHGSCSVVETIDDYTTLRICSIKASQRSSDCAPGEKVGSK